MCALYQPGISLDAPGEKKRNGWEATPGSDIEILSEVF
ncbi:unnamed protein product, partial [marine sediment metagenome]